MQTRSLLQFSPCSQVVSPNIVFPNRHFSLFRTRLPGDTGGCAWDRQPIFPSLRDQITNMSYFAPVADSMGFSNNLEELAQQRDLTNKYARPAYNESCSRGRASRDSAKPKVCSCDWTSCLSFAQFCIVLRFLQPYSREISASRRMTAASVLSSSSSTTSVGRQDVQQWNRSSTSSPSTGSYLRGGSYAESVSGVFSSFLKHKQKHTGLGFDFFFFLTNAMLSHCWCSSDVALDLLLWILFLYWTILFIFSFMKEKEKK